MRLLIVEDDPIIGETLRDVLQQESYVVDWFQDGNSADTALRTTAYDLVILDLGLPGLSGFDILRNVRQTNPSIPVLILSAQTATEHKIQGLDIGADDYITKPFDLDELLARIRAHLRKQFIHAERQYRLGSLEVDLQNKRVFQNGSPVILSAKEWAVFNTLISRPGQIFSRSQLEEKLYDWQSEIQSNTVEVHIHSLRKKLGSDIIRNSRGLGYYVPQQTDTEG